MYNNNNNNFNHPAGNSNDYNPAQAYNKNFPQYSNSNNFHKHPDFNPTNSQQFQGNGHFQNNQGFHKHQQNYQHPYIPQKFHQNYFNNQQQQPRMWNKRPHSTETQNTYSPEPKRQQETKLLMNQQQSNNKLSLNQKTNNTSNRKNVQETPQTSQSKANQNPQQSPKQPKHNPAKIANDQKDLQWDNLFKNTLKKLEKSQDHETVNILRNNLQPTRAAWSKIKDQITNDMMRMMASLNVAKIFVFGSTLTGLDFFGSDLDYFVELHKQPLENELKEVLHVVSKMSRRNPDFRVIYRIDKARVPIVRLIHYATGTFCDVNFTSKFGYYNSYFIGHVLNYDPRIKELAIILKLWSKSYKIAERSIMSNYCLIMIMIYFLQNLEHPMLITIQKNQSKISKMVLDTKSNWNFNFNDDIDVSKNNKQTTRELLVDFFEFISKISYQNYILSMYTGELILKTEFNTHNDLAVYRETIKSQNITPIKYETPDTFNIQDGFELNVNIGIKIKKHVDEFFELVKLSFEMCQQLNDKTFSEMLIKLFTDIKIPKKASKESKKADRKIFFSKIHSNAGDLKICQDILSIMEKDNKDTIISIEACQLFFAKQFMESTKMFLEEIYCADVEEIESESDFKRVLKVTLFVDTVNSRKKINFTSIDTFAAEKLVTAQKVQRNEQFNLDIEMTIQSLDEGKTFECHMNDNLEKKKSSLGIFGSYFAVNIVQATKFYLKKKLEEVSNKD
ncbi:unnamed protein product [Diamesa serratosioi]